MTETAEVVSCRDCGLVDDRVLFARISKTECLCCGCWNEAGKPSPKMELTAEELLENENAIRKQMIRRGGSDKHIVRKGLS